MAFRTYIPPEVLVKVPGMNIHEVRAIINTVINSKNNVMRQADIFYVKMPKLGVLRSHGKKKPKSHKKVKKRDVVRKRKQAQLKELTKEKLLW